MPGPTVTFAQFLAAVWRSVGAKPDREATALAQGLDERLAALEAKAATDVELPARLLALERAQKQLTDVVQGMGARLGPVTESVTAIERRVGTFGPRLDAVSEIQATLRADVARIDRGLADLAQAPPGAEPGPARGMVDLVSDLRGEVAHLFQPAARGGVGDGVVVEGLDVEIRGDLALGDGVGIRPYAPGRTGPEAASTLRFTLRPEVRVVPPPPDEPARNEPPPATPKRSPRNKPET